MGTLPLPGRMRRGARRLTYSVPRTSKRASR